jgi:hypothetical protein
MLFRSFAVNLVGAAMIVLGLSGEARGVEFEANITVQPNTCFNETCFNDIDDYANSPLVECSYL